MNYTLSELLTFYLDEYARAQALYDFAVDECEERRAYMSIWEMEEREAEIERYETLAALFTNLVRERKAKHA